MLVRVRIVVPDRLTEEERELYMRLLEIEGHKPSAKKGKGFFQDIVDKMKESVKWGGFPRFIGYLLLVTVLV